jgi:hypothetical protein
LVQLTRKARFLALLSAGKSSEAKIAMIAITTSSSIKVNPRRGGEEVSRENGPGSGMRVLPSRFWTKAWRLVLFEWIVWDLVFNPIGSFGPFTPVFDLRLRVDQVVG